MHHDYPKSRKAARYLAEFARRARDAKRKNEHVPCTDTDALNLAACAVVLPALIKRLIQLEEYSMKVAAIAAAAEAKVATLTTELANVPPQPAADHVMSDADIAALNSLAAKVGVDGEGNPLPAPPAA